MFSITVKARPIKERSKDVEIGIGLLLKPDFLVFRRFLTLLERQNAGIQHPNYLRGMTL